MSRVCHECGSRVENPFYTISLIIHDTASKRMAMSNLELSLCAEEVQNIESVFVPNVEQLQTAVGYVIDQVTSEVGGRMKSVQVTSEVYDRHGRYFFLSKATALRELPKTAADLLIKPHWTEKKDDEWQDATWADDIYENSA